MAEEEKSYWQIRNEFFEKLETKILPFVRKYENKRKLTLILPVILAMIVTIFGVCLTCLTVSDVSNCQQFLILCYTFVFFAFVFIFSIGNKKDFENKIKAKIMPEVCKCFGNLRWKEERYFGGEIFMKSCVVPDFNSEVYDDVFKGSFQGVNIDIVESKYEIGIDDRTTIPVFSGVILKLDMNKPFKGHTVIKPNTLISMPPSPYLHHTELEDLEFNKKFDVYTNDEVEARYLITPSFMERLKNVRTAFNADKYTCAFYDSSLIIALSTNKDLFSLCSLIKPIDDKKQFYQMYEEMESIMKLIEHFKVNQKIGL